MNSFSAAPIIAKKWNYYNDFDAGAVEWTRELIKRGLIAPGEVDERSILDVDADDVRGFVQCHWFCGIGGWSYALRLAGWPDDEPVWTGSPPCQPFSSAGKQLGKDDERHLAPHFAKLITDGRPPIIFGEQVASSAVFGKPASKAKRGVVEAPEWAWIDDLSGRLEAAHYAVGAADIPAASIGAPHIRQRTFFGAVNLDPPERGMGDSEDLRGWDGASLGGLGSEERPIHSEAWEGDGQTLGTPSCSERLAEATHVYTSTSREIDSPWRDADWLFCRDGKWRPTQPGLQPLVDGIPRGMGRGGDDGRPFHPAEVRVMRLRGYGNAIVPQAAATFITAYLEALQ